MLRALIFDVDGTLAETEELHRKAFNAAFVEAGLNWNWDVPIYARLLKITGGKERIQFYADEIGVDDIDPMPIHRRKTEIYNQRVRNGGLMLRNGVEDLVARARRAGFKLAIATTTSRPNVESLISVTLGNDGLAAFSAIVTGEDVTKKKPDPEAYRLALAQLGVRADEAIAFEDSYNGVVAARGAGLPVIVTPSLYTIDDEFAGATHLIPSLEADNLAAIGLVDALWR